MWTNHMRNRVITDEGPFKTMGPRKQCSVLLTSKGGFNNEEDAGLPVNLNNLPACQQLGVWHQAWRWTVESIDYGQSQQVVVANICQNLIACKCF